jgi:hypothetical protein
MKTGSWFVEHRQGMQMAIRSRRGGHKRSSVGCCWGGVRRETLGNLMLQGGTCAWVLGAHAVVPMVWA